MDTPSGNLPHFRNMNITSNLIESWKQEESIAHIHGWDFSHIEGRYTEPDALPWDYRKIILRHI